MSWSASSTGTPAAVRADINKQLDSCATGYKLGADPGDPQPIAELADIEHARSTINARIDAQTTGYNGVAVEANGSRRGAFASLKVHVTPVALALDEPAAT